MCRLKQTAIQQAAHTPHTHEHRLCTISLKDSLQRVFTSLLVISHQLIQGRKFHTHTMAILVRTFGSLECKNIEHKHTLRCVYINVRLCLHGVIQYKYKGSDAIESVYMYRQSCKHYISERGEESSFSELIITWCITVCQGKPQCP